MSMLSRHHSNRLKSVQTIHDDAVALGARCTEKCCEERHLHKAGPDDPVHPGWPAGTSDHRGGQFRPKDMDFSEENKNKGIIKIRPDQIPPESKEHPVLMVDGKGAPVINSKGEQILRPAYLDPQIFACAGENMRPNTKGKSLLGLLITDELRNEMGNFAHYGPWDAQRIHPNLFVEGYRSYATIAIGIYMAAAGISRDKCLEIQNLYAWKNSHFNEPMDSEYTSLPVANVENTIIGYDLYESGRIKCGT